MNSPPITPLPPLPEGKISSFFPFPEFYPHQREALDGIEALYRQGKKVVILEAPTGCHARGTQLLKYGGDLVPVETLRLGDLLTGPEGSPRRITQLIQGQGELVRIKPMKGEPFVVNLDHVLTLQRTPSWKSTKPGQSGARRSMGIIRKDCKGLQLLDVSIREWLGWTRAQKHIHYLVRAGAIEFPSGSPLPIDPYFLGLLLGDGSLHNPTPQITTIDPEIREAAISFGRAWGLHPRLYQDDVRLGRRIWAGRGENPLRKVLRSLGLCVTSHHKFIPEIYRKGSAQDRLALLAGLLDTDGSLNGGCFDFISASLVLAQDLAFVARSLGLAAYVHPSRKTCQTGVGGIYYRVGISGDLSQIPCRIPRKQAAPRKQKKSVLRTSFTVEPAGVGTYYGFTLEGDGRYLMGDFTVTHNSGKSPLAVAVARWITQGPGGHATLITPQKVLQTQYLRDFPELADLRGRGTYPCNRDEQPGIDPLHGVLIPDQVGPRMMADTGYCRLMGKSSLEECKEACPYFDAIAQHVLGPVSLINTTAFLYQCNFSGNFKFVRRQFMALDEAHNLEAEIMRFVSLKIQAIPGLELAPVETAPEAMEFLKKHKYSEKLSRMIEDAVKAKDPLLEDRLTSMRDRYRWLEANLSRGIFVVELTSTPGRGKRGPRITWEFRPVYAYQFAQQVLFRYSQRALLMSATILDPGGLAKHLGLDPNDCGFVRLPSIFPRENRPVILRPVGPMTYRNRDATLPAMIQAIERIAQDHKDQRGIIHCHSFWLGDQIFRRASPSLRSRLIYQKNLSQNGNAREEALRLLQEQEHGILLAPAFHEGIDLKDDLSRFQILPKVPYPDIRSSRQMAARAREDYFYTIWLTALKTIQSCGRSVRSQQDWAKTYLLDADFETFLTKATYMIPEWFREAIQKEPPSAPSSGR